MTSHLPSPSTWCFRHQLDLGGIWRGKIIAKHNLFGRCNKHFCVWCIFLALTLSGLLNCSKSAAIWGLKRLRESFSISSVCWNSTRANCPSLLLRSETPSGMKSLLAQDWFVLGEWSSGFSTILSPLLLTAVGFESLYRNVTVNCFFLQRVHHGWDWALCGPQWESPP